MSEIQKQKISKLISEINTHRYNQGPSSGFYVWHANVERTLDSIFGHSSIQLKQFEEINFNTNFALQSQNQRYFEKSQSIARQLLSSFLNDIDELATKKENEHTGTDVFIVHGHDNESKQEVARLVERLGLNAIILHEKPNKGRTVIEKLVEESETAGYAIILLTPDDIGFLKTKQEEAEDRPRQNVVLELGYFIGKLKRSNVCALLKSGMEIPSDFSGVLCYQMDSAGRWKFDLAREMKEVGLNIDLDKVN